MYNYSMNPLAALVSFDEWLFFAINSTVHNPELDWVFLFFSFYPLLIWILIGVLLTIVEERREKLFIIRLLFALILSGALTSVFLKPIVRRPRPDLSHGVKVTIVSEKPAVIPFNNDFAFPSGHAAVAFAGAYIVTREETTHTDKKHGKKYRHVARWLFYGFAMITAFSRIYLGKHYPLDVIFGGAIGYYTGMFSWKLVDALRGK